MNEARILIVDDSVQSRAFARATLEQQGHVIREASTGADAIAECERERLDCVLLDIRLPDIDGVEVCNRLRALPTSDELRIIFLTGLRDVETYDRALAAGADDFVAKPVNLTELVQRVQSVLELKRVRTELQKHDDVIRSQRDALIRLHWEKERLMSVVVHDLKNPLNSLDLRLQMMLRNEQLPHPLKASLRHVRKEAHVLHRLVLDLVDLNRAEAGQLELRCERIDIAQILTEVFAELTPSAELAQVSLQVSESPCPVEANPQLLRRVVENLADSALRQSAPGSRLEAEILHGVASMDLVIANRDHRSAVVNEWGDSAAPDESQDSAWASPGHGISLAFCRKVCEAHGGSLVSFRSEQGVGYRMSLPSRSQSGGAHSETRERTGDGS